MDRTKINVSRSGEVMSADHDRDGRGKDDGPTAPKGATRESRIPAAIRAFRPAMSAENAAVSPIVESYLNATAGYRTVAPTLGGIPSLAAPALAESNVQDALFALLGRIEASTTPRRFTGTRIAPESAPSWSFALVAAEGQLSPRIEGSVGALAPDARDEHALLSFLWTQLSESLLRGDRWEDTEVSPSDEPGTPDATWLRPVAFAYASATNTAPGRMPLVDELRATVQGTRSVLILLRRDRDVHPLLRVHNVLGADCLTMRELEAMVRFGEAMNRNLAVLSGSAVAGAHRWFGSSTDASMMVVSMRDLTVVGAFSLDQLGRFAGLSERLESSLHRHE